MPEKFETMLARQTELVGLISRGLTNLEKLEIKKRTPTHGKTRLETLEANWKRFQAYHDHLSTIDQEKKKKLIGYFVNDIYAQCEEAYNDNKAGMIELIASWTPKTPSPTPATEQHTLTSRQLPRINLPKFSVSHREWAEFRDLFTSMVRTNNELPSVEKLQYLKMSVTGEASVLLRNIPVTEENFTRAWETLVSRYENKRKLIDTYLASLLALSPVTNDSASALKTLLDDTNDALGALKSLATPADSWDHIIVYITSHKLDPDSLKNWGLKIGASTEPPSFNDLERFLRSRIDALETFEGQPASQKSKQHQNPKGSTASGAKVHQTNVGNAQGNSTQEKSKFTPKCSWCSAGHYLSTCSDYRAKTNEQRRAILIEKKLCFNCLGSHQVKACKSLKRCQICAGPHHTTIHRDGSSVASAPVATTTEQPSASTSHAHSQSVIARPCSSELPYETTISSNVALSLEVKPVLLATALVKATSNNGCVYEVRALLDQGSEVSFISEALAHRINYPRNRVSLPINGIGGSLSTVCRGRVTLNVASRINSDFSISVNAYILSKLTSYTPPFKMLTTTCSHLQGLALADPGFANAKSFDLVLGAEIYGAILEKGLKKGDSGSPTAQQTALGWILSGSISSESENQHEFASGLQCSVDHELSNLLQRFWLQEEVKPSPDALLSDEDAECERHFVKTHSRTPDGRYVVRLPLKNLPEDLGDSRNPAQLALLRQEKRFTGNLELKDAYSKFLREYEQLGHMKIVPQNLAQPRRVFYLPHHAVLRENSLTTKVRVVFNGSSRTNLGISINDLQHVGPKLQIDLADVITRWRLYGYVFVADIEKMYRQIRVHPSDWDLQRILWRNDSEKAISSYQLCTVTYGLASAPYLALRVLKQLSLDENHRFPLATGILQQEVYVDDVLSGAHDISEARDKLRQINKCLKAGGFVLQKWASNDEQVLSEIAAENKERSPFISIQDESPLRTLGILWQPRSDSFLFASPGLSEPARVTKRIVISKIAQLFDPLGLIAPVVIRGKIILQELWKAGLEWDEPIPEKLEKEWTTYEKSLADLTRISIPRWFGPRNSSSFVELHGFSDASQAALGAVFYLRIASDLDDAVVSLISAKTKVAPLKKVTIPRLELSAAVLLTRQVSRAREVLNLGEVPTYLWTDSTVTLAYIHGDAHRWAEFVQNRVTVIKKLKSVRWQHVPGTENPADLASKGISPLQLATDTLWWKGPAWLSRHSTAWPSTAPLLNSDIVLEIRKKHSNLVTKNTEKETWDLVNRFSSLVKLIRVTAWCFRAVQRFKRSENSTEHENTLTPAELDKSRLFWVKVTQAAYFEWEIRELRKNCQLSKSSSLFRLVPFLDTEGLVRLGGRIGNSTYSHDEKHPLILPRESQLTTLIIDQAHRSTLHGGTQVTLATLRRRYWIVGGRVPIRAFIHRCVICARHRAALGQQLLGQLPQNRFARVRPFLHAGVDLAGPLTLRTFRGRGAKTYKGYIVVFVCFSSSAIHLEIVTDYSTDAFLAAFKRFSGHRGICETITSDCGTNLVGAATKLKILFKASSTEFKHIASVLANDGTLWKFNPPSAPHFGGKWEAAVKSVKFHIKRIIGDTGLTYEEYSTLLTQIEAVLNSRPLCALSDDPADLSALTPGHFLIGSALNTIREPSLIDLPSSRVSRWQLLRQMLEHFWKRWSIEYIQQLQIATKWQREQENMKVGALVLVKDERYPPSKWALGRIIEVHPGNDNLVRVVTVPTQNSTLKRTIVKLCLLPVSTSDN